MRSVTILPLFLILALSSAAQIVFMVPAGKHDSLDLFREVMPGDPEYAVMSKRYTRKPFTQTAELYRLAQVYLQKQKRGGDPQPVYLALTQHQGGFPMRGFALKHAGGKVVRLPETDYIDLHRNT